MSLKTKYKKLKKYTKKFREDQDFAKFMSSLTYPLYDKRKIKKLKKFPPKVISDKILFESGNDFTDNARALYDYLIENGYNDRYKITWLVREPKKYKKFKAKNVKFVKSFKSHSALRTAKAYKEAYSSKYLFYTTALNWVGRTRKEQVFIDLWHGCGYKANKGGRKVFFDYCLVPGDVFVETKKEFFNVSEKKLLALGYPRYDKMLNGGENAKQYVEDILKEHNSNKMILWMPTYRHSESTRLNEETLDNEFNIPIIDDAGKLKDLDEYCKKENILLVIKKHYMQIAYDFGDNPLTNILYLEDEDLAARDVQLYEFIHYSDALVSDYSSVIIDYLLLNKPIGFTLDDFDAYTESRGWVFENPLDYMPGHHIYNMDDMKKFIDDIKCGRDDYKAKRDEVIPKTHNVSDNYCKRIVDYFNI